MDSNAILQAFYFYGGIFIIGIIVIAIILYQIIKWINRNER